MKTPFIVCGIFFITIGSIYLFLYQTQHCKISCGLNGVTGSDTIIIQPFNGISPTETISVFNEIRKLYPYVKLNAAIQLPSTAFYAPRGRYRADSLIAWLSRRSPSSVRTMGLTNQDISTTKDNIPDWGIMGLGYQPGNACVVSTFRLKKANLSDQLAKVSAHEIGHMFGLPHCPNSTCLMRDAEGQNHLDEETDLCTSCHDKLRCYGWK